MLYWSFTVGNPIYTFPSSAPVRIKMWDIYVEIKQTQHIIYKP